MGGAFDLGPARGGWGSRSSLLASATGGQGEWEVVEAVVRARATVHCEGGTQCMRLSEGGCRLCPTQRDEKMPIGTAKTVAVGKDVLKSGHCTGRWHGSSAAQLTCKSEKCGEK